MNWLYLAVSITKVNYTLIITCEQILNSYIEIKSSFISLVGSLIKQYNHHQLEWLRDKSDNTESSQFKKAINKY